MSPIISSMINTILLVSYALISIVGIYLLVRAGLKKETKTPENKFIVAIWVAVVVGIFSVVCPFL